MVPWFEIDLKQRFRLIGTFKLVKMRGRWGKEDEYGVCVYGWQKMTVVEEWLFPMLYLLKRHTLYLISGQKSTLPDTPPLGIYIGCLDQNYLWTVKRVPLSGPHHAKAAGAIMLEASRESLVFEQLRRRHANTSAAHIRRP